MAQPYAAVTRPGPHPDKVRGLGGRGSVCGAVRPYRDSSARAARPVSDVPFRAITAITGFACPGCGSLRALHDLAHGHFTAALIRNALLVMMLPFAVTVWLRAVTGRTGADASPQWLGCAAMAVLAAWTVVRNLSAVRGILKAT
jgi:hypothetical protein